jgi:hypothetical protein
LICGILFTSCGKAQTTNDSDILCGKWQLQTISPLNAEGVDLMLVDFSPKNIIYEFRANNVLIVSGNVPNGYGGLKTGKYFYKITRTDISDGSLLTDLEQHVVVINSIPHCFSIGYVSYPDSPGMFMACSTLLFTFLKK